ncbi:MAG: AI-2E family transporter [Candidatus Anaerobiospirillum pullicola]|uniref:AI-2E family transporter n=1 Tax=Candidatus Anaerobiospirillum pullicola TaxID=2838451 RepID=A0A948THZ2_9GAMM|nr:AI-2E family transporter [Candidatus Anaerobiospirillum pullicola]
MSQTRERYFEWTLLSLILLLGIILFYEALPFLNGALGAITLYILLRKFNLILARKTSPRLAPWIITLAVTIFVLLPLSALLWYIIDTAQNVNIDMRALVQRLTNTVQYLEQVTHFDLMSEKTMSFVTAKATGIMNMLMSGINEAAINIFTAILLLFFLLSGGMRMERAIARCLPFNDENKRTIISKISTIVRSNAIGIPLLAVIQGAVAAIGYTLCGIDNAIPFGALTGFASMIPVVGSMLVWIPLTIMQYFEQGLWPAVYVGAYGALIISQCDNVLRMILQKRMANTHPLITIFGVIAGLPLFGFMGLIFGPLMVAMFLLFLEMFISQYIIGTDITPPQRQHHKSLLSTVIKHQHTKQEATAAASAIHGSRAASHDSNAAREAETVTAAHTATAQTHHDAKTQPAASAAAAAKRQK